MNKCIPIYFVLANSKIVKDNGENLLQRELLQFWNFMNMLIGSRYTTFIIRGESNENLRKQYNYDINTPDILAQCIFMAGEKGRICWTEKKYLDPDDTSLENFQSICELLNSSINEGCRRGNVRRMHIMQDFFTRNQEFCNAFENIDDLTIKYNQLAISGRRKVNLYYLSIAHTINSYKYQKASSFVSTTTSPQVADIFTNDVSIYGWIPKTPVRSQMKNQVKSIEYVIAKNKSDILDFGFPYCDTPVYPEQKEILLRCGILPHFIIGFNIKSSFYVNPAIFNSMNDIEEINSFKKLCEFKRNLITNGLSVDQSDFEDFCRKTNFKRYYTYDGEIYQLYSLYQNCIER